MNRSQVEYILKTAAVRARARKSFPSMMGKRAAFGLDTLRAAVGGAAQGSLDTLVPAGIGAGIGALIPTNESDSRKSARKRRLRMLIGGVGGVLTRDVIASAAAGRPIERLPSLASMGIGAGVGAFAGNRKKNSRLENALRGALLGDLLHNSGMYGWYNAKAYNS